MLMAINGIPGNPAAPHEPNHAQGAVTKTVSGYDLQQSEGPANVFVIEDTDLAGILNPSNHRRVRTCRTDSGNDKTPNCIRCDLHYSRIQIVIEKCVHKKLH